MTITHLFTLLFSITTLAQVQSGHQFDSPADVIFGKQSRLRAQEALKNDPKNPSLLSKYAEILFLEGDSELAKETYEKIIAIDKSRFPAYRNLAKIFISEGSGQKALAYLEKAKSLRVESSNDPYFMLDLGKANFMVNNMKDADSIFTKLLSGKDQDKIKIDLAEFMFNQNQMNQSREYFQEIHDKYPKSPIPNLRLGQIYKTKGKSKKAKEHLNKFLNSVQGRTGNYWSQKIILAQELLKTL